MTPPVIALIEHGVFGGRKLDLLISKAMGRVPAEAEFDPRMSDECAWRNGMGSRVKHWTTSVDAVLEELPGWSITSVKSHQIGITSFRYCVSLSSIKDHFAEGTGCNFNLALCAAMLRALFEKNDAFSE